jgi:hypothetical protein
VPPSLRGSQRRWCTNTSLPPDPPRTGTSITGARASCPRPPREGGTPSLHGSQRGWCTNTSLPPDPPRTGTLTAIHCSRPISAHTPCRNEFRRTSPFPVSAPAPHLRVDRNYGD